jgi:hypothetical protein
VPDNGRENAAVFLFVAAFSSHGDDGMTEQAGRLLVRDEFCVVVMSGGNSPERSGTPGKPWVVRRRLKLINE